VEVTFGSFGWLCTPTTGLEKHLSIRLTGCPIGARFCDFVADLASKDARVQTSSAITSLRKAAGELRATEILAVGTADNNRVQAETDIFFDEAAHWSAGELIDTAAASVSLVSSLQPADDSRLWPHLVTASQRVPGKVSLVCGGTAKPSSPFLSHDGNMVLSTDPQMKANALLGDGDSALLTNHSWLREEGYQCRPYGSSVALLLRGAAISGLLVKTLDLPSPLSDPKSHN
jgi:hypothetical protein